MPLCATCRGTLLLKTVAESVLKSIVLPAFFIASLERRSGISLSMMSVLTWTWQLRTVTGMMAEVVAVKLFPSPNLKTFLLGLIMMEA